MFAEQLLCNYPPAGLAICGLNGSGAIFDMMYKYMIHLASALPALCRQYRYPGFRSGGRLPCQRCEVELTFLDLLAA